MKHLSANTKCLLSSLSLVLVLFSTNGLAEAIDNSAEEKGLSIAIESEKRDTGFVDSTSNMVMELKNRQGDTSIRHIRLKTLEVIGDGDKSMSIFDKPADIKGTAFLTYSHTLKADEQWLYLPALKRIKRISSTNKSGSFMGSEFAFEDISSQEIEKYTHLYLRDEVVNSRNVVVVERVPTYKHSGYSRQEVWWDAEDYRLYKILFFDRKKEVLKIQTVNGHALFLEHFWRPLEVVMENQQTGKSTTLFWKDYEFHTGLTDKDFTRNALKRAK